MLTHDIFLSYVIGYVVCYWNLFLLFLLWQKPTFKLWWGENSYHHSANLTFYRYYAIIIFHTVMTQVVQLYERKRFVNKIVLGYKMVFVRQSIKRLERMDSLRRNFFLSAKNCQQQIASILEGHSASLNQNQVCKI